MGRGPIRSLAKDLWRMPLGRPGARNVLSTVIAVAAACAGGASAACDDVVVLSRPAAPSRTAALVHASGALLQLPVAPGDTLGELAERVHLPLELLVRVNALDDPDFIRAGSTLEIPANPPWTDALSPAPAGALDFDALVVRPIVTGDTLGELAAELRVPARVIVALNRLDHPDVIPAGGGLLVPAHAPWTDGLARYRPPPPAGITAIPCDRRSWSAPGPALRRPGHHAACALAPVAGAHGRRRVCSAVDDASAEATLALLEEGRTLASWPVGPWSNAADGFQVDEVDLDGDGEPELVVAAYPEWNHGVGHGSWRVAVLDGKELAADAAADPLLFVSDEYGTGGLVALARTGTCDVLPATWRDVRDPLRGPGTYLAGRRFRYAHGALRPLDGDVLARRLDGTWSSDAGGPGAWLAGASAWPHDAFFFARPPVALAAGTVVDARRTRAPDATGAAAVALTFRVRWADGSVGALVPSGMDGRRGRPDEAYDALGDAASAVLWPDGYVPAAAHAFLGEPVLLTRSATLWGAEIVTAWLGRAAAEPRW